ncbi:unnamed protein product [Microthlaspi erraticum]|uniref:F-box domain-containing protein n=1 Tax=Microthlaspi erraticum TaxID=1685480 RepID=A0A6D2KDA9_9BRAS|nr:unnamed protein product [Microthlaspi erraticum]
MPTMSDLPEDLVGEILSKLPLTSLIAVRSTCKNWYALSNNQVFGKGSTTRKQFLGFMLMDSRVYSMKLDLQGIHNDHEIGAPSVKQVSILGQAEITKLFHCNGLVLCVTEDKKLLLWNPYLGQTRLTRRSKTMKYLSRYDNFGLGYDNINGYHKILRVYEREDGSLQSEIYDCNSTSWKVLGVHPEWFITYHDSSMSVNENTYFLALENATKNDVWSLLCFDFTAERFGPLRPLPFQSHSHSSESVALSCVRDEKLALLYRRNYWTNMEIWITTEIDPNSVSWSKFLDVDTRSIPRFRDSYNDGTFFIDHEKKVAVLYCSLEYIPTKTCWHETAYIIGEDGYSKSVVVAETPFTSESEETWHSPVVFSSYVPSLVQLRRKRD